MSSKDPQLFTDEYLEHCKAMNPLEVVHFLESYRKLKAKNKTTKSKLISLKVPQDLLDTFRTVCEVKGVKYQTMIKQLMRDWVNK